MKKLFPILCAALLAGCGETGHPYLAGRVLETRPEGTGTAFLLQTPEGEEYGILLPEGSRLSSTLEDFDPEAFRRGQGQEAAISAEFLSHVEDLSFFGGEALPSYAAEWVEVTGYRQEEPLILEDGSQVFLWQYAGARAYTLPEGQELLWVHDPGSPDQSWTAGTESFASLPAPVQARILEYYRAQGPLYEEQAELERAFRKYRQAPEDFSPASLRQDTALISSSQGALYFRTSGYRPTDGRYGQDLRLGQAIRRDTGEPLEAGDLFLCPPEEMAPRLLELADLSDPALRSEMEAAFSGRSLLFFPEHLEIAFPAGSLPSQEHSYLLGLDWDEELAALLQPWALPYPPENS